MVSCKASTDRAPLTIDPSSEHDVIHQARALPTGTWIQDEELTIAS